jgi:glycosyltransferase involved in cell wall biosynthesis
MATDKKLRVLIIAEAANPEWTSVPLIGWSLSEALSKICDCHLATQIRNRDAIERAGWTEGKEFTAIDSEKVISPLYKLASILRGGKNKGWTVVTALSSLAYPYFEYQCWKKFKASLKAGDYDLVHRITPVSPTAGSLLSKKLKKIGIPYIVGPLNGGVPWPKEFRDRQHQEKEWLSHIRNVYKILPGYKSLRKNTSAIIVGSKATQSQMPAYTQDKIVYIPENAIDPKRFSEINSSDYSYPIKAAFVGRLVPYKGADIAIRAMEPLCKQGKMTFDIYGNGPEEKKLQRLVKEKSLEEWVKVHGFVDHKVLQKKLVLADLFVFPSVREFGGGVILEAMALGVVPVVADYAGPSELVDESNGYKIPISDEKSLIDNFKIQLESICKSPETLASKRQACLSHIPEYYTWFKKAEQIKEVYNWVLYGGEKPHPIKN